MQRKIIYFSNPISGTKNKTNLFKILETETVLANIEFEILPTNKESNYDFLIPKIKSEKITDVVVCGGDGTVNQIAFALQGIDVNIGIIPMGSGNGLAFAANIPKKIKTALQIIFEGKTKYIDAFYINKKFSCMLCGIGFDAQVAHDFANQKKRGLTTYVRQTIINFIKAKPYAFSIKINEHTLKTHAFFISIANSNQFGNHFTIAPKASLHDGLLDIVVVNKMSKLSMLQAVLKQIRIGKIRQFEDKKNHQNKIHYFQTNKLEIQNPQLAPLHIDGDPAKTAENFSIEIIENSIRLLMPLKEN